MKRLLLVSMVIVSAVLLIAGCDVSTQGVTYTVSGTISFLDLYIDSPASITVTQGGNAYAVTIPLEPSYDQTGTYSISDVPPGDYKIEVVFISVDYPFDVICSVDGVETLVGISPGLDPDEWKATIDSLSIGANTTIDLSFSLIVYVD